MKNAPATPFRICIIEDDPWYGQLLHYQLSMDPDYEVVTYATARDFFTLEKTSPHVVTIDFSLPDITGDQLLKKIRTQFPDLPVIVISAQSDIATAVELLRMGASDYLVKDEHTKELLWNRILNIREKARLCQQVRDLEQQLVDRHSFSTLLQGHSPAIRAAYALMERAAQMPVNVSITGETGTGKELAAKAVHLNSERRNKPFVAVNMAAIPAELLESELFGHEKGSFTGAVSRKIGKFEEANGGTLFLDEIGELTLSLQAKLLRVLQERELQRVGGNEKIKLNVRLITATHQNLAVKTQQGLFRQDLYYRIMGLPIELPPLRERGEDILFLARYFLHEFCQEYKYPPLELTEAAQQKLLAYNFPGNVRELKTLIELAAVLCNHGRIQAGDLRLTTTTAATTDFLEEEKTLREYTYFIIRHHMQKYDNNVPVVAKMLDVGRSTIYKMIQEGLL